MTAAPLDLAGATLEEVQAAVQAAGQPAWRAKAVCAWVHRRGARTLEDMTDLPKALRASQDGPWRVRTTTVARRAAAADGTVKFLIACGDGQSVEAVLIPDGERRTLCISTQVGCGMACRFCATGTMGMIRNLTAAEIVEQVLHARDELGGGNPSNLVFMGMGEPLANYDALVRAITVLNADWGVGLGARRITVSTVGIPGRIRDLAALRLEINLAVSLHAPTDDLRTQLVPPNANTGLARLMDAADVFWHKTGRRVTFEYVLLDHVNDGVEHAAQLAELLAGRGTLVNLLPMNPVAGLPDRAPSEARVAEFTAELDRRGVTYTLRRRRGDDIAAACGQLRLEEART